MSESVGPPARGVWDVYPLNPSSSAGERWPYAAEPPNGREVEISYQVPGSRILDGSGEVLWQRKRTVRKRYYAPSQRDFEILRRVYPDDDPARPNWLQIKADLMMTGHRREELEAAEVTLVLAWLSKMRLPAVHAVLDRSNIEQECEAFAVAAKAESRTAGFRQWAGAGRSTLVIVFTDLVGSTRMAQELGDQEMRRVREAHFRRSRQLLADSEGLGIKSIGDAVRAVFHSVEQALEYTMLLLDDPGHSALSVRAGIHVGPMDVTEDDVFGSTVNCAARVVGAIKGAEIWLSDRAKTDLDTGGAKSKSGLKWDRSVTGLLRDFPEVAVW